MEEGGREKEGGGREQGRGGEGSRGGNVVTCYTWKPSTLSLGKQYCMYEWMDSRRTRNGRIRGKYSLQIRNDKCMQSIEIILKVN